MKFLKMMILSLCIISTAQAKTVQNSEPQLQHGESITGFLNKNPQVQKTWITAEDRKRAALTIYVDNCKSKKKDCGRIANSDGLAKTANNTVVKKLK